MIWSDLNWTGADLQSGASMVLRALATYLIWIAIGVGGATLLVDGKPSLAELVSHRVGLQFVASCLFLIATIQLVGWPTLGFVRPHAPDWPKLLWLPALFILGFFGFAIARGLPAPGVIAFVAINTAMVGFSEETMFRGILFQAFRKAMPIWPAIWLTTILFGAVHILNVFITGEFGPAIVQAVAAGMSGLLFMALLIRTGSIWTPIVFHALWDCGLFLLAGADTPQPAGEPTGWSILAPCLMVLPNFLFALYLLRNIPDNAVTQRE